jgi:hypothetical protein
VYSRIPVRIRLSLAIFLTLLLAANVFLPTLCAAHCSPANTATHHHQAPAQQKKGAAMCDDCFSTAPQLHAFTCPNATQIDARTEPSFTLGSLQQTTNSVLLKNPVSIIHGFLNAKNDSQDQPTPPPQDLVATAPPLRL